MRISGESHFKDIKNDATRGLGTFLKENLSDKAYSLYEKFTSNQPINPSEAKTLQNAISSILNKRFKQQLNNMLNELSPLIKRDYFEEGTGKTGGDRIWFDGFVFDDIKKGDIFGRPLTEGITEIQNQFLNALIPGEVEHTEVYGGFRAIYGKRAPSIINPYPDPINGPIHIEDFFSNMHFESNLKDTSKYIIIRPSDDPSKNSSYVDQMIADNKNINGEFSIDANCSALIRNYINMAFQDDDYIKNPETKLNTKNLGLLNSIVLAYKGGAEAARSLNPFLGYEFIHGNNLTNWKVIDLSNNLDAEQP